MVNQRVFTLAQVVRHKSNRYCWFIINGRVLNVTKFLEEHPGGAEVLIESSGLHFNAIGHSKAAKSMLVKYQSGVLEGFNFQNVGNVEEFIHEGTQGKEITVFVIKKDMVTKYSKFVEFFVPLMVVGFSFGYWYLARVGGRNC